MHINLFRALLLICFASYNLGASIIINELQPAPLGDEPEWIELYNPDLDTLKLIGYKITDNATTKDLPDMVIPSLRYALLTKDTIALKSLRNIPEGTLFFQSTLPGLNNTFDMAVISDLDGNTVDSMYYDLDWGEKGVSFERIDQEKPAHRDNIAPSKDSSGATAGRENSVIPVEYDLSLTMISNNDDKTLLQITNLGKRDAKGIKLNLFLSKIKSAQPEIEIIKEIPDIPSGDSLNYEITTNEISNNIDKNGFIIITSVIDLEQDKNPDNDSLFWEVYLPIYNKIFKINEFLYEPETDNSEFIEFINTGKDTIDIYGWMINDQYKQSGADEIIIENSIFIPPSGLFVIAMDSSFLDHFPELIDDPNLIVNKSSFNLNNDTDEIILRQPNGDIQDSLRYYSSWHSEWVSFTKNISLERKSSSETSTDQSNWVSSTDSKGSTPLEMNSCDLPKPVSIKVAAYPNPFSRISSKEDGRTKITIEMPFEQGLLKAYIFTPEGILVAKIADDINIPSMTEIYWDGRNDNGYDLQIGPYVLLIEIADLSTDEIQRDKIMLVIGE
jgi:hypothetical protein